MAAKSPNTGGIDFPPGGNGPSPKLIAKLESIEKLARARGATEESEELKRFRQLALSPEKYKTGADTGLQSDLEYLKKIEAKIEKKDFGQTHVEGKASFDTRAPLSATLNTDDHLENYGDAIGTVRAAAEGPVDATWLETYNELKGAVVAHDEIQRNRTTSGRRVASTESERVGEEQIKNMASKLGLRRVNRIPTASTEPEREAEEEAKNAERSAKRVPPQDPARGPSTEAERDLEEKAKNAERAAALAPRDYSNSPTMSSEAERAVAEQERNATIPSRDYSNSPMVSSEAERDAVDAKRNAHLSNPKPEYVGPSQEELDADASVRNRERLAVYKEEKAKLPLRIPADFVPAKPLAVENEKEIALKQKDSVAVQKSTEVKKAAAEEKKQARKEKAGKVLENTTSFFSKSKDFLVAQGAALGQKLVALPGNAVRDVKKLGKGTKQAVTHPFESWEKIKSTTERAKAYGAYFTSREISFDEKLKKVGTDVYALGEAYRKLPFETKVYLSFAFLASSVAVGTTAGVMATALTGAKVMQKALTGLGFYTLTEGAVEVNLSRKEESTGIARTRMDSWKKHGLAVGIGSAVALGLPAEILKGLFVTGEAGTELLGNLMGHASTEHVASIATAVAPAQPDILSGIPKPPFMPKIDPLATGPDTAFIGPQGGNIYDTSIHLDGSPHTPLPPLTKYPDFAPAPAEHVAAAPIETPAPAPAEAVAPAAPEAAVPVPAEAAAPAAPPAPVEASPSAPMEHAHAPRSLLEPKPRITDLAANTREQLETKFLNDWQAHMADHPDMPSPPTDQMNAYIAQNMPGAQSPVAEAVAPQAPVEHPLNEVRVKLGLEPLQPPGVESHVGAQDLKIHPDTAPAPVEAAVQPEVATPLETHAPADITPAHTEAPTATPIETAAATAPVGAEPPIPGHPEIQPNQFGLRIDEHVAARFTDPKGNNIIFGGDALKDRITAAQTWVEQDHAAVVYFDFTTPRLGGLLPDVHRLGRAFWDPTTNQVQVENELMNPEMRLPGNVPPNLPAISDLAHRVPAA